MMDLCATRSSWHNHWGQVPQSFSYVRGILDLSPPLAHSHTPLHKPVDDRLLINVCFLNYALVYVCDLHTQRMTCTLTETLSFSEPQKHTRIHC